MSPPPGNLGSLLNLGNILQSIVQGITQVVAEITQLTPAFTSGQMSSDTLVFTGFVRVTGVSVVEVGSPAGGLYDAANIAAAASDTEIFPIAAAAGFYPLQMIFESGLVYKAGSGEKIAIFYVRS